MKSKKNILLIILAMLLIARVIVVIMENKHKEEETVSNLETIPGSVEVINPDATLSKTPVEAVTSQHDTNQNDACQSMRARYQNLEEVKKTESTSMRFVNVHKKVDGIIYRQRFFYKDSSENEIPTYLLYKEDQSEDDYLVEKSSYKKGPQYLKIEKAVGTIVYTEEGVNIGADQDLFLHYENKVLKDLQGISPLPKEKDFIECRF